MAGQRPEGPQPDGIGLVVRRLPPDHERVVVGRLGRGHLNGRLDVQLGDVRVLRQLECKQQIAGGEGRPIVPGDVVSERKCCLHATIGQQLDGAVL